MTEPNLIEQAITYYWGERCEDYEPLCIVCQAWRLYDDLCDRSAQGAECDCGAEMGGRTIPEAIAAWNTRAEAADRIEQLEAEVERLREALREVFEEWAGSEGFIPETAPEGYLLQLTKRMTDIARAALGESHD